MKDFWIILLDPESAQIYTQNIRTKEIHIETGIPLKIEEAAEETINNIKQITGLIT